MNKNLPTLSVIIPAHNEEGNLKILFESLKNQKYPKSKIEYIVVDDNSTDRTFDLAHKFGAKVVRVDTQDIELNKGIGMKHSKNELVYFLDADMEVCEDVFFQKMVRPFTENKSVVGTFTKEFSFKGSRRKVGSLLRFISYDPLQRDPLYKFMSASLENTFTKNINNYFLCKFIPGEIPSVGRIMYRKNDLMKTDIRKDKAFIDMESVEIMARKYKDSYFAYVPNALIRHYHTDNLSKMVAKRLRNLNADYLPNLEHKYFLWFDPRKKKDVYRIFFWMIYANLIIPELFVGIFKSIKYNDRAFLWHPVVSVATTDAIIFGFLSKPKGRKLALELFKRLFNKN